ncbi:D-2-hydroxyacid dehydrogenase [Segetibacter sp. 3557_3]|uniref:D-2-hydroxyacid dehydrogenase n=1 Tax=Segetibacter sp. 3557_3 TaxID=2547429 RepID=UPI0010589CCA|nr:D-2-hydroxyacid dehydrogenase [Segetibacter sp. 3557_3]TDH21674.1 D-2-hydroxyacid dehydrogenase [Segetibacter sp. 3557_3]
MKIVVLDGYALNPGDLSWDALGAPGELQVYDRTPAHQVVSRAKDAAIVFTNKTPLPATVIAELPELRFIGVLATGYNVVDVAAANQKGIVVSNIPGYGTSSVVQMTFALLLELCHRVQRHSDSVFDGMWTRSPDWCYWNFPLLELAGKTIGIVGFGHIGAKVADVATAFGMKVVAYTRTQTDQSHRENFRWVPIKELFETVDVVSIHCPLVPETRGLINKENLARMKRSAFVINTSRGPIVNEYDLANALNTGVIAAAAVDVLSDEPPTPNNPLLTANNCLITPHIAWATFEARSRLMNIAVDNLHAFLQGKPVNVVH